ncbi:MAG: CarD family transcriptional regulator, partial [Bacteroidales bacterium]|nr:CarD family transcriptional regulator [Bacteroidales bacterium]
MLLTEIYQDALATKCLIELLKTNLHLHLKGVTGSLDAVFIAAMAQEMSSSNHLVIASGKEEAFYLMNDIETLLDDADAELEHKRVLLFPSSQRKSRDAEPDAGNVLLRSEAIKQLNSGRPLLLVTYPEAMMEKVVSSRTLTSQTLQLCRGAKVDMDFAVDVLMEYDFERVDFVVEPGQYAVRGGIIDVFSYGSDNPYRIEFQGDAIESLRTFDPVSQLSIKQYDSVSIIPNLERPHEMHKRHNEKVNLLHYYGKRDVVWGEGLGFAFGNGGGEDGGEDLSTQDEIAKGLQELHVVEMGANTLFDSNIPIEETSERQPLFNKQFDLLLQNLANHMELGYRCFISTTSSQQKKRLERIFSEFPTSDGGHGLVQHENVGFLEQSLRAGFIDHTAKLLVYTDHEIFERYHKYTVRDLKSNSEALTMKELLELKPGDYVTHIDFGVGQFAGLQKIDNNGKQQEVIRLSYKGGDTLYISIHSLHKISRYVGKEGAAPSLDRLGSKKWELLKQKTKKRVKDIAKELISLYAKRKASQGFSFSPDNYLQNELEASFMYEDTPDQLKATREVKHDMESCAPMDRLVCGDVGFGKTEVAMRAAFKAVCDNKQVAVLVPSTILAFQHYNTFCERLKGMPVNIDYLNRFRTANERKRLLADLESGKIDILIGTHAITSKDVKYHDLGLLIVDEEQKFGVSMKEKLRQMKVNVDCLTLTATPIPRTLQ